MCVQKHMLYVQAYFIPYNNFFIRNLKLSLTLNILSNVNKLKKCYECPLLSISARSLCRFKVLQELGLWRELLFTELQRNVFQNIARWSVFRK
jgi:hypothetical protein